MFVSYRDCDDWRTCTLAMSAASTTCQCGIPGTGVVLSVGGCWVAGEGDSGVVGRDGLAVEGGSVAELEFSIGKRGALCVRRERLLLLSMSGKLVATEVDLSLLQLEAFEGCPVPMRSNSPVDVSSNQWSSWVNAGGGVLTGVALVPDMLMAVPEKVLALPLKVYV